MTGYPSIDKPWDKCVTNLSLPNYNFYQFFMKRSKINASNILAVCSEDVLTMDQLKKESLQYANAFYTLGIRKGDIIPLCLPPCNLGIVLFFALNRLGAISTFLNEAAGEEELHFYQKKYHSKVIVSECDGIGDSIEALVKVIVINGENSTSKMELAAFQELGHEVDAMLDNGKKKDEAFICYTSGSTGEPKAIVLTNENIMASMLSLKKTTHMQFGPQGNCMQVVPFNYPYGFLISTLFPRYVGKTAALTPHLKLDEVCKWIRKYRPRYIQAIPSFYKEMMRQMKDTEENLSYLRYEVSGGDTLDLETKKQLSEFNRNHRCKAKICDGSGNGEGCGCLTTSVVLGQSNWQSVGKPIKGLNVKIVDADTQKELSYDQTGLLCFSGAMIMKEYYGDPETTKKVLRNEGGTVWFHTDTYGHIDKNGWLYLDGRDRRFFITFDEQGSPYKVYCDYVQSVLKEVLRTECVVVKKQDDSRGFVPVAFILRNGERNVFDLNVFRGMCGDKLNKCAIPVAWYGIDAIPLTEAGKVDYRTLEKMAEAMKYL